MMGKPSHSLQALPLHSQKAKQRPHTCWHEPKDLHDEPFAGSWDTTPTVRDPLFLFSLGEAL